jgi:archaellum component FlaC
MSDDIAYHTLEYLKAIRSSQERVENDIKDLKFRVGQIEHTLAHHSNRFDRIEDRLGRIEKRLDLVDA